jgi:hypothetical protein
MRNNVVTSIVCGVGLSLVIQTAMAGRMYRWTDENGDVHYGSEIPSQYLQQQHKQLNEQGVTTRVYQRTKTPEEAAREEAEDRRRQKMRAEEQRRIAEQQRLDQILLQTYSSLDDMELARDGKITAIEAVIRITKSNIAGMRSEMARTTSEAAAVERSGQVVSPRLRKQIAAVQEQIEANLNFINEQRQEQDRVREHFTKEMIRYARLRQVQDRRQQKEQVFAARSQVAAMVGPIADSATVLCKDTGSCARAWKMAQAYVKTYSGPAIQVSSGTLIMTYEPRRDDELGMYVARYPEAGDSARIVMEVVCAATPGGAKTCGSESTRAIRSGFKTTIESSL